MISLIVPAYHESDALPGCLQTLFDEHPVAECYVVDASDRSEFESLELRLLQQIRQPGLHYLAAQRKGRAQQMNQGAVLSSGAILLFLHADTVLPPDALIDIQKAINSGAHWGRFDVRFDQPGRAYRMIASMMNWRSRHTGIATGDQAIFVSRGAFDLVGGYEDIALMEDISISKKLKQIGPPACLQAQVVTSARRWEQNGVFKTILLMWWLRLAYWLGVSPERLAGWYRS